jgi:DNA repair photolyase
LITRDFDLLKQIDESATLPEDLQQKLKRGVIISFSVSTLDEQLAKQLESGAPSPKERLETLKKCKEQGFLCGLNAMPLLPFISDTDEELEKMVAAAKEYAADYILTSGMTLFGNDERDSKQLYYKFLRNQYPHLLEKYESMYGSAYYPSWKYQDDLKRRTKLLCEKYNIRNSIL